jgi:NAD(P)H-hydrate epimerase
MIAHYTGNIPFIEPADMEKVEDLMLKEYGISRIQIMENAGLNLALLAKEKFLNNKPAEKTIGVVAGTGMNGGTALVAARRLKNWGAHVFLVLASEKSKYKKEVARELEVAQKLKIPIVDQPKKADLIIDGIMDKGNKGNRMEGISGLIEKINGLKTAVLTIDAPSGLDLTTGKPAKHTIKANATLALAMPKIGLFKMNASKHVGDLYLADIGVPPEIFKNLHLNGVALENIFRESTLVRINKVIVFN